MLEFVVDLDRPAEPFPHYWEICVGSCHAAMALREDWRRQLEQCHRDLGFRYIRFHGLLDDDMSVYCKNPYGRRKGRYSFFNVDAVYDFLLSIGMKPFVELSFMPSDLASGPETIFHYRGNVTLPVDYGEWGKLIYELVRHLVERYGPAEVRSWFFEVWNEPNLTPGFWTGTMADYFELYRYAAEAIKRVDPGIPVGGPATAGNAWIPEMVAFCRENGVPLDFVSTHHYPGDKDFWGWEDPEGNGGGRKSGILTAMARKARREAGRLPLYYTEWNPGWHLDEPYAAAALVKTILDNQGLVDIYSYWTFSDLFEEWPFESTPFHDGFGLQTIHGIAKPSYRAFQLLHAAGRERIPVEGPTDATVEVAALTCGRRLMILAYNHDVPGAPIRAETVRVLVRGAVGSPIAARVVRIDEEHANAKKRWLELGSPVYPDRTVLHELRRASELKAEPLAPARAGSNLLFELLLLPHAVAAIMLDW